MVCTDGQAARGREATARLQEVTSFRRGGINAIRDAARKSGMEDMTLRSLLMRFGRWKSEEAMLV